MIGRRHSRGLRAFGTVVALTGLVMVGPVDSARADDGVDQITGNGDTSSAVTASWSQGILGADNKTVVAPRDPNSPLSFMYDDFKNLKVTVGQTQSLVHQTIKVSWTGGKPTIGQFQGDYLQLMQCYGDAETGPDPEQCEYGSTGMTVSGNGAGVGTRNGNLCEPGSTPSTASPPPVLGSSSGVLGCDTREPSDSAHIQPGTSGVYSVPFVAAGTTDKLYDIDTQTYFDRYLTNEVQQATTNADGTGEVSFEALTDTEASGLGCGAIEANGQPRDCWLVIVPRGEYKANGARISGATASTIDFLNDSPLGASNWAQRIQIHLAFSPLQSNCPIGSAQERETVGTEMASRAVFSWQLALNDAANCTRLFGYTATSEPINTTEVTTDTGVGLAFTTIPIGSEASRLGTPKPTVPPLVYAPVAASALTFAFNISLQTGLIRTPIKITPRLLAKSLTQSYTADLPDYDSNNPATLPAWAAHNPQSIVNDPEFRSLNPEVPRTGIASALAPLVTADPSALNQQVWQWIQSDQAARDWLAGKADENGMVVNDDYKNQNLGAKSPAPDDYERFYTKVLDDGLDTQSGAEKIRNSNDLLPYVESFDDAARRVHSGNSPNGPTSWNSLAIAPNGKSGYWDKPELMLPPREFVWGVTDSASLADYSLVPASLCDSKGDHCVDANTSSLSTALASAKPDKTGLLHVDPAHPGSGGYPLVDVTYAAARLDQDASTRDDYAALIEYAAGQGQTPGNDPGNLPPGYLPLPDALRRQAAAAGVVLRCGLSCSPSHSGGSPSSQPPGSSGGGGASGVAGGGSGASGGGANGGNGDGTSGGTGATSGANGKPTAGTATGEAAGHRIGEPLPAELASKPARTPHTSVGVVRWVLVVLTLAGLVGVVAGPLTKSGTLPRLLRIGR